MQTKTAVESSTLSPSAETIPHLLPDAFHSTQELDRELQQQLLMMTMPSCSELRNQESLEAEMVFKECLRPPVAKIRKGSSMERFVDGGREPPAVD